MEKPVSAWRSKNTVTHSRYPTYLTFVMMDL
jgi:hypothetical protein